MSVVLLLDKRLFQYRSVPFYILSKAFDELALPRD
jgi:hypothetical protein